ncbi:hypothetical protein SAMD00019534_028120 [Acytostelium subglobosum LB1]|uniref:hypothetical protein n=1 Tax=Acytostelium subglobosum LB1 TaxID=1410327 RepID=UPI000644C7D3|nr:hypothetical protein SAMD00019534_028120 [Acytostelium subglobosum LB1]GAM19637.1 hypothetical protein SAMD00019534_028120 [Acytostelium subglobosum LB1]|eukprot:XP_012756399.1 hypothetical protein SAMD00019534_028120 [Acytostelium subglobosum LB1]
MNSAVTCSLLKRSVLNIYSRLQPVTYQTSSYSTTGGGHHAHGRSPQLPPKLTIDGVKHIVAVSSAKGGVGKSTMAVNLALALSSLDKMNLSVGILDADVFGPSLPIMMNLNNMKPSVDEQTTRMIPLQNYGVKCMSMGFLVEPEDAIVWRGPMVMSGLERLLRQTQWGSLDVLIVDLPPGTGDAILTMCQRVPLSGAVIVSTPQDVALADVIRGVKMFKQVDVPILGVVENMSYFECTNCNHKTHIFGNGGAKKTAESLGIKVLGEVPLSIEIRELSDSGKPITVQSPDSVQAQNYKSIARNLLEQLYHQSKKKTTPTITFDD